ncbi:non-ribosomal peptide synthetase [Myxococcus stipitatus DSM 14675]|uniref:Non-ribosomal peptide synthetase n=1 Tax=Myxococcus stipitatus (strain DSM 14675 / JCM 12634 / Mx s8) TaxID=1278073 RepID=L7UDC2_MYXSD|nr:myxochelin non-ribosomal peptide synthetase MxcG [Myxococcus stipitatus]AGC45607.1 non-ribosomal peptide synthetase [Myxococcus stipitatus DSM 14675]
MPDSHDARWPLSAAQHGIWVGQQLDLASPIYNAGECIELRGSLVAEHFEAAVRQTVDEAEALHARFETSEGGPVQWVSPRVEWVLQQVDVSTAADPWVAARAWMNEDLKRTVDLTRGPLFAEVLFRAGPERHFWFQRVHHIAMDGYGFSLLARRVAELYTARVTGRPAPASLAPLRPVLDEDAAYRASPQFEQDRAFWVDRLTESPLPVTLAPPAPMSPAFVRATRQLTSVQVERMQGVARPLGLTWPDLVLAAAAAWIHLRTDAPEVVLGLPVMTRLGSVSLRVPCMAMNIVPLRVPVAPGATLASLARNIALELRSSRPHLRYRYEQLRRDLRRVGGQRKLFGPVVNIMPFDYGLRFSGLTSIAHNISAGPVEDLSIGVYARSDGGGLRVDFDANPVCYDASAVDAHQQDFLERLDTWLAAPEQPVHGSAATDGDGRTLELSLLDGGPLPGPAHPVLTLIQQRVREQPESVAVEHGAHRLTYQELWQRARELAARLVTEGVRADTPVAVKVPRGLDAVVASLGILLSGAGYLPLDPNGPESRAAAILEDAAPSLMVVPASGTAASPRPVGHLAIERRAAVSAPAHDVSGTDTHPQSEGRPAIEQPAVVPASAFDASRTDGERLAYVIYTSGSTGQPNGVQITHGALAHFVAGATHRYGLHREDRVLQFAPLHFDASVEEIFLTLCAGARLVLRTDEMLQSVPRLLEACTAQGITVLDLPTAFWHELAYAVSTEAARLPDSVRIVIIGGEAALPERVARWRASVRAGVRLLNTYGPTEATVVATMASLGESDTPARVVSKGAEDEVPIGLPLPGVRAALIDAQGRLVAKGAEGELCLLGGALARGYLGRPELDRARFISLSALPDQPRAYRTGDKARMREDGQLVFVGRVDDELKISGHRIDPSEVETVLLGHPGVREAAVVGQQLPGGSRRLCAHVVAEAPIPSAADLRKHLLAHLPAPMVPSAIVFTEHLPRTSTGKIDRTALRKAAPVERASSTDQNTTELERVVLGIWEEVLGATDLTPQDDFFDRGGQSLQSIQVANRLGIALGREVPVATVFRYPTAAALAQALEHGDAASTSPSGPNPAMLADAELSEEIVPKSSHTPPTTSFESLFPAPRQALLTGATGFVGAHLLDQLLRQTQARVVCLVRARDEAQALERIRAALTSQQLSTEGLSTRVVALPSDLTKPWLGLDKARFHGLAAECDVVLHNAAVVSVVREYGSVQAVNVQGTRELLRLAATARLKPFHYVSTLAVAPQANVSPEVPEDFVPAHPGLRDGYQQSKWVAERLVQQASERGLPVAVYRLGRVVGASDTALVNPQDLVWRILLAGVPSGSLPMLDVGETWTPVDYVAQAIVALSRRATPGTVFNLTPVPDVRLPELFRWVREYGYPVEMAPIPEWRARVAERAGTADNTTTLAFFDLRSGDSEPAFGLGPVRCQRLHQSLEGTGITCPQANRDLFFRYLNTCVARGLLPPTPGASLETATP